MSTIILHHNGHIYTHNITAGETILTAIREIRIPGFSAPCGGNGTCGKCKVLVLKGTPIPPDEEELQMLSPTDVSSGVRLACRCRMSETPLTVSIPDPADSQIATGNRASNANGSTQSPRFTIHTIDLPDADLNDQRSILTRSLAELEKVTTVASLQYTPAQLQLLSENNSRRFTILMDGSQLRSIHTVGTEFFGAAVDIGTTTIVIHLVNLATSAIIDTWASLNEQKAYGADVISRIQFSMEHPGNRAILQKTITDQLTNGILYMLSSNKAGPEQLKTITITGNTTMLHLLVGCDTAGIAAAPFIPVFTENLSFPATDIGMSSLKSSTVELLPSIAAYVGADITAGTRVTDIAGHSAPALLLDIGTNGEMVLGHNDTAISCSTAAGPAFEGANISCGTGGISGAIDSITLEDGKLQFTTIGNKPPIGICGSGIIDAAAILVSSEAVDYTGRLASVEECDYTWIDEVDGETAMIIADSDRPGSKRIVFTQKDMREVQLAKAAVAAGIRTMAKAYSISPEEIDTVYLAGGFGSYIHTDSAGIIGLLPNKLSDKSISVGNTACEGALRSLLLIGEAASLEETRNRCSYVELSSNSDFQNFYIEEMYFGDL